MILQALTTNAAQLLGVEKERGALCVGMKADIMWSRRYRSQYRATVEGEVAEGLPGSLKSVACVKRNTRELGRANWFRREPVSEADQKKVN